MATQITGRFIANSAVTAAKIDLTGTFDFSSGVVSVASPSSANHAASKSYVDNIANGLHWKDSVKIATTANITLSGTQTIDGIAISADERVLVRAQSTGSENGIYLCKSGAWERAADMDSASEFSGSAVFVQQGNTYADIGFVCTNDGDVTVGTTAITFTQFSGAGQFTAGDGLDLTGTTFSVNVDDSSIEINADSLRVKALGITNAMLAGSIENAKLANSTISGVALGSNLNALSVVTGSALTMTSYNGSAARSDLAVQVDDSSIQISSNALQIKALGVTNAMLAGSITADKLATGAALDDNAGALEVQVDDSSIEVDGVSNNLQVKALGVTNAMLAGSIANAKLTNSTISGVSLGSNLNSLSAGNGLTMTAYNGSAAVSDLTIDLDGATLAVGADGIKISAGGVDTNELAGDCVTNAKIADDAVQTENLNFAGFYSDFTATAAQTTFDLGAAVDLEFKEFFLVTVNGLAQRYSDSPSSADQYTIANDGSGGVARITFGSGLEVGDLVAIRGFVNN